MPPETKLIITKLEDMVCRNCIYSVYEGPDAKKTPYSCHEVENRATGFFGEEAQTHFCSKGKWLTGRLYPSDYESNLNLEDFDDTYYGIVRAQMFPDAVSIADEHAARNEVLKLLSQITDNFSTNSLYLNLCIKMELELRRVRELLVELWGDQE
jgi:hypothetical protein